MFYLSRPVVNPLTDIFSYVSTRIYEMNNSILMIDSHRMKSGTSFVGKVIEVLIIKFRYDW